jgi:Leucine rich repeat
MILLVPAVLMAAGCEEGPATQEELDAIAQVQQLRGHVITNQKGHCVRVELAGIDIANGDLVVLDKLHYVTTLSLEATPLTDAGLAHLKGMTQLKRLSLRRTKITDAGLANLEGLSSLEELDLEYVPLTNQSIPHLAALGGLRKLYVGPSGPTEGGLDTLREANPQLHIFQREK